MRPAGTLLLAIARLLFDESVLSRAVYPTIADLQEEVREAGADRRRRLLARWRGYRAFWILVLAAPIACWSWPMTPQSDRRALRSVSGLIAAALVLLTVLATGATLMRFDYVFELPQAIFGILGGAHVLAFMAGPVALVLLAAVRWLGGSARFTVRPAEATILTLLSATVAVTTGSVVVGNAFTGIARTGGGGLGVVVEAGVSSLEGLLYAVAVVAACLFVMAVLTLRPARGAGIVPADRSRMPARLAVAISSIVTLVIVVVDLLLRSYYRTLDFMLSTFEPGRSVGSIGDTAEQLAHNVATLFVGGGVPHAVPHGGRHDDLARLTDPNGASDSDVGVTRSTRDRHGRRLVACQGGAGDPRHLPRAATRERSSSAC